MSLRNFRSSRLAKFMIAIALAALLMVNFRVRGEAHRPGATLDIGPLRLGAFVDRTTMNFRTAVSHDDPRIGYLVELVEWSPTDRSCLFVGWKEGGRREPYVGHEPAAEDPARAVAEGGSSSWPDISR